MKFIRQLAILTLLFCVPALVSMAAPGVKHATKTTVKFHGFMGSMMRLGGGDKPQLSTTYVQGNVQRTDQFDKKGKLESSSIIDLDREVFIKIDHKRKEYSVMTFADWKNMMNQSSFMGRPGTQRPERVEQEPEVKVDFDIKVDPTGETAKIAGLRAEKVIVTMKGKGEKQATPESQGGMGGMIITSTQWLAKDAAGYDEIQAFSRKFAEKLGMAPSGQGMQQAFGAMLRSNPQVGEAMEKLAEEGKKLQGFAVKTESVFETWAEPGAMGSGQTPPQEQQLPSSVGGLLGGLGKKFGKKEKSDDSGRNVLFESTTETIELETGSWPASFFQAPSDYKKVERKM